MKQKLYYVCTLFWCVFLSFGQTTILTNHPNNNGNGSVIFNVQNTNSYPIKITGVNCHLGSIANNNIQLLYKTTPIIDTAQPWDGGTVGAGQNGWVLAGTNTVVNSISTNGIVPVISNINISIPAGTTYQLGLSATTMQYSTLISGSGINTFSANGVNLLTGDGISWGGPVYPSTPANYPRGLIGGITFEPITGTHLNFDGVNDIVDFALPTIFNNPTTNAFSVEVLVNPSALLFSRIFFAQKDFNNFFSISLASTGAIYAYLNNTHSAVTNSTINTSTWTLVTVTKEANTNAILIYFNGVLQATTAGGTSSTGTDDLLTLGSRTNQAQFFNGNLDEVRIWNRVLPANEILSNFNCELQNPLSQTGLVGYYKFNQGIPGATNTGVTTVTATVGTNGTLNNFALTGVNSNWLSDSQIVTGSNCTLLKINDFSMENELKIYPNPSTGIFNIQFEEDANVTIHNLLGKLIYTNQVKAGNSIIDISNYQSGIYLINIKTQNGSITKKIIKE